MELKINGQQVDLPPAAQVALTIQSNDITRPDTVQSSYSNSLTLPFTERNHRILGNANQVTSLSDVPYAKLDAEVLQDGVEVMPNPKAYLLQASEGYEVDIFSGNLDLFEKLEDKSIRDLDLSRFDHLWNFDNVLAGSATTRTWEQGFVYIPVDTGKPFRADNLWAEDLHPSIYAKVVFEQLLEEAGVSYTGIEDELWNKIILPFSNEKPLHTQEWLDVRKSEQDSRLGNIAILPVTDHGILKATFEIDISAVYEGQVAKIGFDLRRNGVVLESQNIDVTQEGLSKFEAQFTLHPVMDLTGVEVIAHLTNLSAATNPTTSTSNYNYFTLSYEYGEEAYFKTEWAVSKNLPDIKQKDFLKAVRSLFDLMVMFDAYANKLIFTPFNKLEANKATAKDWSDKLVTTTNQPVPLQYRFGEFAQKSWFRYKEDELGGGGDNYLSIGDGQLESEKDVVIMPFAASSEAQGVLYVPVFKAKEPIKKGSEFDKDTDTISTRNSMSGLNDAEKVLVRNASQDNDVQREWAIYEYFKDRAGFPNGWQLRVRGQYYYDKQKIEPRIAVLNEVTTDIQLRKSNSYSELVTTRACSFDPISFEALLPTRYTSLQGVLDKAKGITPSFLLNAQDVANYDPSIPIWLDQYQSYFYLNSINEYTGEGPTQCQLWRL